MQTKSVILPVLLWALLTSPTFARIAPQLPGPISEAPVERAIDNVEADTELSEAQRYRVLGRLHLIAYAQRESTLRQYATGEWTLTEDQPCGDPAYRPRANATQFRCPLNAVNAELPKSVAPVNAEAREHLRAAEGHYARAIALDGTNLRARLGFAFVLDKLARRGQARQQLREIIPLGLPRLDQEWISVEDHAVLWEVVDHLGDLARSRADRRAVDALRTRLGETRPVIMVTPIFVPLSDKPFDTLVTPESHVAFDFTGVAEKRAVGWLSTDAAWLVWDPNRRSDIHSGFDLIGQRTWGVFWSDGFEALRALDDDRDGELVGSELGGLALWRDENSNGVSELGEVRPLSDHGVVGLATRGAAERTGLIIAPQGVRLDNGVRRPLYDWTPDAGPRPNS